MSTAIKYILFAIQLVPTIIEAARKLQELLPQGSGPTKLKAITEAVSAVAKAEPTAVTKELPVEKTISIVQNVTSAVVDVLKPTGALGPVEQPAAAPAPVPAA